MAKQIYNDRVELLKSPTSGLAELIHEADAYIKYKQGLGYLLDSTRVSYKRDEWENHVFVFPNDAWKVPDIRPHSRACGIQPHEHGTWCHSNCPTCGGK